jgi:uncharacterized membrane protein YeiH
VNLEAADIVTIFDRIGIVAFALSGVEVGMRRRLDIFGLLVMGVVTSTGGGLMRDVALTRTPLVLDRWDYLAWAIGASVFAILLAAAHRRLPFTLVSVADAVGLGAFAVAGAFAAIEAGLPLTAVLLLSILTATGGGVVRDLLADRVPLVLRAEVNATAALAGGLTVWLIEPTSTEIAALTGAVTAALVRVVGLAFNVNLPVPGGQPPGSTPARDRPRRS